MILSIFLDFNNFTPFLDRDFRLLFDWISLIIKVFLLLFGVIEDWIRARRKRTSCLRTLAVQTFLNTQIASCFLYDIYCVATKDHLLLCITVLEELLDGNIGFVSKDAHLWMKERNYQNMKDSGHEFVVVEINGVGVHSFLHQVLLDGGRHHEHCEVHHLHELSGVACQHSIG